jgi:DnaJ-domain-containing protein 1
MTPFKNRLKTPEEIELEHKYQQLAGVKVDLQRREQDYHRLKSEIRLFEQVYEDMLGGRIQSLEDLEWQLMGLLGETKVERSTEPLKQSPSYSHFQHTTDLLDDDETVQDGANLSLKSLYRGVAKAVHPDLAADESERLRRQELMALANEAYQAGNRQVLIDLLSEWEQAPVSSGSEMDIALELVRVIRQLAAVRQNIHAVVRQTEELKQTDIYHLKLRVDDALVDGVDLLVEMAAAIDLDIARIRRRLSTIRGESGESDGNDTATFETRIIRFPAGQNCGTLFIRKASSLDFRDWQRIGVARGAKEIFLDTSLRLDVKAARGMDTSFLGELQPGDLQSLFLYGCDDSVMNHIVHLTGLQELYLSDADITDQGVALLRPLVSLQRISIYHTAIGDKGILNLALIPGLKWLTCSGTAATEEGLNLFRMAKPGCKTVNFKWRY